MTALGKVTPAGSYYEEVARWRLQQQAMARDAEQEAARLAAGGGGAGAAAGGGGAGMGAGAAAGGGGAGAAAGGGGAGMETSGDAADSISDHEKEPGPKPTPEQAKAIREALRRMPLPVIEPKSYQTHLVMPKLPSYSLMYEPPKELEAARIKTDRLQENLFHAYDLYCEQVEIQRVLEKKVCDERCDEYRKALNAPKLQRHVGRLQLSSGLSLSLSFVASRSTPLPSLSLAASRSTLSPPPLSLSHSRSLSLSGAPEDDGPPLDFRMPPRPAPTIEESIPFEIPANPFEDAPDPDPPIVKSEPAVRAHSPSPLMRPDLTQPLSLTTGGDPRQHGCGRLLYGSRLSSHSPHPHF